MGVEIADLLRCEQGFECLESRWQTGLEFRSHSGQCFAVHKRCAEFPFALDRVEEGSDVSQAKSSQFSGCSHRFGMAPQAKRSGNRRQSVALCSWLEVTVGVGGWWSVSRKRVLDQAPMGRLPSGGVFVHSWASMRFSLQVQYAICGSFDLAYNGGGKPVQIRVISARQAIPVRYLEQIFQRLRRAGLIHSKRGPGGGYTLARAPEDITLQEIIEALEGPLSENLEMSPPDDPSQGEFRPTFIWGAVAGRIAAALSEISLDALCKQAVRANLRGADPDAPMYHI